MTISCVTLCDMWKMGYEKLANEAHTQKMEGERR